MIKQINSNTINSQSIKKIYKWRFKNYRDKFICSSVPTYDEHTSFINNELINKNNYWFGYYNNYNNKGYSDLIGCSCLLKHDYKNSSIEFGRLMVDPVYIQLFLFGFELLQSESDSDSEPLDLLLTSSSHFIMLL